MECQWEFILPHVGLCLGRERSGASDGWRVESDRLWANNVTNGGIGRVEPVAITSMVQLLGKFRLPIVPTVQAVECI